MLEQKLSPAESLSVRRKYKDCYELCLFHDLLIPPGNLWATFSGRPHAHHRLTPPADPAGGLTQDSGLLTAEEYEALLKRLKVATPRQHVFNAYA